MNYTQRPLLMSVTETAHVLEINRAKVYDFIDLSILKAVRIGHTWKIRTDSVEKVVGEETIEEFFSTERLAA